MLRVTARRTSPHSTPLDDGAGRYGLKTAAAWRATTERRCGRQPDRLSATYLPVWLAVKDNAVGGGRTPQEKEICIRRNLYPTGVKEAAPSSCSRDTAEMTPAALQNTQQHTLYIALLPIVLTPISLPLRPTRCPPARRVYPHSIVSAFPR